MRLFRRAKWDAERARELDAYLQIETDENVGRGMSPDAARAAAQRKLGNSARIREEIYRMNTLTLLDSLGRDLRYALRTIRRNPTFTVIVVLTLALGIGATTAMFSVVNGVLLHPLPYPDEDRLVELVHEAPGIGADTLFSSPAIYFGYRDYGETFESVGHWDWDDSPVTVTGVGEPESIRSIEITHEVLSMLGADPILGRSFAPEDDLPGSPPTVVISYGYWQRRFGGDDVRGRTLVVDGVPRQVIGVLPRSFRFFEYPAEIFYPLQLERSAVANFGSFDGRGIARLKPGVSLAAANADVRRMIPLLIEEFGGGFEDEARFGPRLRSLKESVVGNLDETLWTLMGTIGILMAVACANVANLVLVRTRARRPELAIRAALGAGWGGITRVVLVESTALGLVGGVLGLGVAYASLPLLGSVGSAEILRGDFGSTAILPQIMSVTIDPAVVLFTLGISLIAALLFAVVPAVHFVWEAPTAFGCGGRLTDGREGSRARDVLVVSQVALALLLLVGAGLMIRSFQALRQVDPGFRSPETVQTFQVTIPNATGAAPDPLETVRTQHAILDQLSAVAGVDSAGFVTFNDGLPLDGDGRGLPIQFEGPTSGVDVDVQAQYVSPNFFETMQTQLIAGRTFNWNDVYDGRRVVLISEGLARSQWGSAPAALGGRITLFGVLREEVIGVVADVHHDGIGQPAPPVVAFTPIVSQSLRGMQIASFVVRSTRVGTAGFLEDLRKAAWSVNPNLSLANVQTLGDIYQRSISRTSVTLTLLLITATIGMLLGLVGIYGVVSYAVAQRRREIGIRLALGAPQGHLRRMFVRHALVHAGLGVVIGLGAATALTRLIESQLFGVSSLDPSTYAVVAAVLMGAALLASYLPARRTSNVDPVEVLKAE
jgi:predicted permease